MEKGIPEIMKKVVVIGPESTGKSTLCEDLARFFKIDFLKEYARTYLELNGAEYTFDDVIKMAEGQIKTQNEFFDSSQYLKLLDTDLYVYKVWIEEIFQKEIPFVETNIKESANDLYLLCDTDLPWGYDEFREHPDLKDRIRLFERYAELLKNNNEKFFVIQGDRRARLQKAITEIKKI